MSSFTRGLDAPGARPPEAAPRKMTRVLMRMTVILTVSLGVFAGGLQMLVDLKQEKDAVEINATELVDSLTPTAAKTVYDFDDRGAQQVAAGLFTQRAVVEVVIWESDRVYLEIKRESQPTLPEFGAITTRDRVTLTRDLYAPGQGENGEPFGRLQVTVDRSNVPPAIVDRMFMYFVIAVVKNILLGALLIFVVFRGLARHVVRLARTVEEWTPAAGAMVKPEPPRYLGNTELDVLGAKIVGLAESTRAAVRNLELSNEQINMANRALRGQSQDLSAALQERNDKLKRLNLELSEIANKDGLTSLYNRRYFESAASEQWRELDRANADAAIILIDIDHFKAYNDFYGHQKGDDCLCAVAAALGELFADMDGLFARYGGEEFIALVPDLKAVGAEALAQRVVDCVAALEIPHARSLNSNHVSISLGLAGRRQIGEGDLQQFVGAADRALYAAKAEGRGRFVIATGTLLNSVKREEETTRLILDAIKTRAFEPFYQPQFDARTGRVVGVEALARWRRADGAVVGAGAFLPKAEELGLDANIDAIIQEKALEQLRAWRSIGLAPARFSMNMSEKRLLSGQIPELVAQYRDINDGSLAFELLESTFVEKQSSVFEMRLDELRDVGAAIEIDDFGTGHTSLVGIATVAPERIKIARELVTPLGREDRAAKVIEAVVEMAQAFEIDVIAEGVETQEQASILIELKCPIQQGYLHGRPCEAADAEMVLRERLDVASAVASG